MGDLPPEIEASIVIAAAQLAVAEVDASGAYNRSVGTRTSSAGLYMRKFEEMLPKVRSSVANRRPGWTV